jgi:hypothetical protein
LIPKKGLGLGSLGDFRHLEVSTPDAAYTLTGFFHFLFFASSLLPHYFFISIGFAMVPPLTRIMHDDS